MDRLGCRKLLNRLLGNKTKADLKIRTKHANFQRPSDVLCSQAAKHSGYRHLAVLLPDNSRPPVPTPDTPTKAVRRSIGPWRRLRSRPPHTSRAQVDRCQHSRNPRLQRSDHWSGKEFQREFRSAFVRLLAVKKERKMESDQKTSLSDPFRRDYLPKEKRTLASF